MNKFAKALCMMAVVALAFTSCKKNDDAEQATFACTSEQLQSIDDEFEKAYINNNNQIYFEEGDRVAVFNCNNTDFSKSKEYVGTAQGDGTSVAFYAQNVGDNQTIVPGVIDENLVTREDAFYAYYPFEGIRRWRPTGNMGVFRLNRVQEYRADANGNPLIPRGALYMAAKDETAATLYDCNFKFKNICGILSLKLYSPSGKSVEYIQIHDNAVSLTGNVSFRLHRVDPVEMTSLLDGYITNNQDPTWLSNLEEYKTLVGYTINNQSGFVTLDCTDNPVALGNTKATATRFLIVLRPGALINGCTIYVKYVDEDEPVDYPSTKNNVIRPNFIRNMVPINVG